MDAVPYTQGERWLHAITLKSAAVRQLSFDLDGLFARPGTTTRPVYICGLARSGTTILLRVLHALSEFRSLTYRDMPFVLAPNLWHRLQGRSRRHSSPRERVHGDGLMVDPDSPEGFEEVFWRTYDPDGDLARQPPGSGARRQLLERFADYRRRVVASGGGPGERRYLSKNNNNLVRLGLLLEEPTATLLVSYRAPVATASSLLRLHRSMGALQAREPFVRSYMGWLGHHEFGLDHKPPACAAIRWVREADLASADYWLQQWIAVHEHLLCFEHPRLHLVDHDRLRREPVPLLRALLAKTGATGDPGHLAQAVEPPAERSPGPDAVLSPALLARASDVHRRLQASPSNVLPS